MSPQKEDCWGFFWLGKKNHNKYGDYQYQASVIKIFLMIRKDYVKPFHGLFLTTWTLSNLWISYLFFSSKSWSAERRRCLFACFVTSVCEFSHEAAGFGYTAVRIRNLTPLTHFQQLLPNCGFGLAHSRVRWSIRVVPSKLSLSLS